MTENEAIKWLREMQNPMMSEAELYCAETYYGSGKMVYPEPEDYVFETAIQALEEIQQYRAIGTVEDLKTAIKYVSLAKKNGTVGKAIDSCAEYESIGTIEEFKNLKEKNEPKKAIGKRKYDEAYCPACNEVISDGEFWALDEYVHHCNYCGQAVKGVDWSE